MESVARIYVVWELRQAGQKAEYIAERVGVNRATVYRWLRGIRQRGIKGFVRRYRQAKKGHRHRKTHSYIEQRVLALRREHHECCGEKIVYWLKREKISLSRSTVPYLEQTPAAALQGTQEHDERLTATGKRAA